MMLHGLQRVGIDTRTVCLAAATSHALLTDPDARVPEVVLRRVWREAARHSADPHLGLHTGELAGAPLNNALMYIILSSRDLEDGLRRAVRRLQSRALRAGAERRIAPLQVVPDPLLGGRSAPAFVLGPTGVLSQWGAAATDGGSARGSRT